MQVTPSPKSLSPERVGHWMLEVPIWMLVVFFLLYNSFLLSHYHICLIERIVPNENKYFIELFLFELSLLDVEYYCFNFSTMELFEISILWVIFMTFMWQIWTHHLLNIFNLVISYNEWLLCLNYSLLSVLFRGEKLWVV